MNLPSCCMCMKWTVVTYVSAWHMSLCISVIGSIIIFMFYCRWELSSILRVIKMIRQCIFHWLIIVLKTDNYFYKEVLILHLWEDTPTCEHSLSNTISLVHTLSLKRQDTNHINCFLGGIENPGSRSLNFKAFKSTKQENIFKIVSCQSNKLKTIYTADSVSCVFLRAAHLLLR